MDPSAGFDSMDSFEHFHNSTGTTISAIHLHNVFDIERNQLLDQIEKITSHVINGRTAADGSFL